MDGTIVIINQRNMPVPFCIIKFINEINLFVYMKLIADIAVKPCCLSIDDYMFVDVIWWKTNGEIEKYTK